MKSLFIGICVLIFGIIKSQNYLELNLKKGDYNYMNATIKGSNSSNSQSVDTELKMLLKYKVTHVLGDKYWIDVSYESMYLKTNIDNKEVIMDSEAEKGKGEVEDLMNLLVKSITDFPFQILLNKQGELIKLQGWDKLIEHMSDQLYFLKEEEKQMFIAQMDNVVGEDKTKEMMEQSFSYFPTKPLKLNLEWTKKINDDEMLMTYQYKIIEITDKQIVIKVNSIMLPGENQEKNTFKGTANGLMYIDPTSGWIIKSEGSQSFEVKNEGDVISNSYYKYYTTNKP